jgi:hypothetical protein
VPRQDLHGALCESGIRRVLGSETDEPVSAFESFGEKQKAGVRAPAFQAHRDGSQ